VFAAMACTAVRLSALEPFALPNFQLIATDGQTIKSSDLPSSGHWLLVYVQPANHFCDALLRAFSQSANNPNMAKVIIVVQGNTDDVRAMQKLYPYLGQSSWYSDSTHNAFAQLKLGGIPVTVGIDQRTVVWVNNGVLPNSNVQKTILISWIK
jgi:hypothetical protein